IAGGILILRPSAAEPLLFGPFVLVPDGKTIIAISILLVAFIGWVASCFIPRAAAGDPGLKIQRNIFFETGRVISYARKERRVFLAILGISWFWLIGITILSLLPPFVDKVLGAKGEAASHITTLVLTLFSIGIAVGSLITNRLLAGEISAKYVPFGALGITVAILGFCLSLGIAAPEHSLVSAGAFLAAPENWPALTALFAVAVAGGVYIVPLYAIMQHLSEAKYRARVIAGNNILNALFMVASSVVVALLLSIGMTIPTIFLLLGLANLLVALYICKLLPEAIVKPLVAGILKLLFKVEVRGLENYAKAGSRAVIVANHVSWLDGMLLAAFLPRKPTIAVDTFTARFWWASPFLSLVDFFPVDPTNPLSTKSLIKVVREDRHCVIFPEGRLTTTGALMKVYEGPGMIADKADADLLPVRIDGAQFSKLSRLKGKLPLQWFPRITLTILPPCRFDLPEDLQGRKRREVMGEKLYEIMSAMVFKTSNHRRTVIDALLEAERNFGPDMEVLTDASRQSLSYKKLIRASFVLGRKIAAFTKAGDPVGLLLPNATASASTFFALQAFGRVPALLNYTSGSAASQAACKAAG
ncbi:MAG: 1-acyl-sn-glycerol-3-phosphate acyltransferase, partial [Kiloniellales bacterium]|nr:1-acyl-sn-glycerol-3-phosphate acyltransferase [Kiloniellales bacterium]